MRKQTRRLTLVLALAITLAYIPVTHTVSAESGEEPFLVANEADLGRVGSETGEGGWTLSARYRQTAHITLTSPHKPIGTEETPFDGSYDGGGYTISEMTAGEPGSSYQGLFGVIGVGGAVENVGLAGARVIGINCVGGIAGSNYGTVRNCYVTGSVEGESDAGRMVGGYSIGGVAGYNEGELADCYAACGVAGLNRAGGVAGRNGGTVKNCVALNPYVAAGDTAASAGRVAGAQTVGDTLEGNYALKSITVTADGPYTAKSDPFGKDGGDIAEADAVNGDWWIGTAGWDFENVWDIRDGYPELRPGPESGGEDDSGDGGGEDGNGDPGGPDDGGGGPDLPGPGEDSAAPVITARDCKTGWARAGFSGKTEPPKVEAVFDLVAETVTCAFDGTPFAGYAVNGKWARYKAASFQKALMSLLNSGGILTVASQMDKNGKSPYKGAGGEPPAYTVEFPKVEARPKGPKLGVYYGPDGGADGYPGSWGLSENGKKALALNGYVYAELPGGVKKPGEGTEWATFGEEGIKVKETGAGEKQDKTVYYIKKAAAVEGTGAAARYIPAGKMFKVTALSTAKAPKLKADYKKEMLRGKAGIYISNVSFTAKGFGISGNLDRGDCSGYAYTPPTGKKPASQKQPVLLAPRAAAPSGFPGSVDAEKGKVTLWPEYEAFDPVKAKWGQWPKFVKPGGVIQVRAKNTAKQQKNGVSTGEAAGFAAPFAVTAEGGKISAVRPAPAG